MITGTVVQWLSGLVVRACSSQTGGSNPRLGGLIIHKVRSYLFKKCIENLKASVFPSPHFTERFLLSSAVLSKSYKRTSVLIEVSILIRQSLGIVFFSGIFFQE